MLGPLCDDRPVKAALFLWGTHPPHCISPALPNGLPILKQSPHISFLLSSHLHCCLSEKKEESKIFPFLMSLLKSRKTKARLRGLSLSRKEREKTYFFVEVENILSSLICKQNMSVWKGYSSGWHRYTHTHTHTHTHTCLLVSLSFFNFLFSVGV